MLRGFRKYLRRAASSSERRNDPAHQQADDDERGRASGGGGYRTGFMNGVAFLAALATVLLVAYTVLQGNGEDGSPRKPVGREAGGLVTIRADRELVLAGQQAKLTAQPVDVSLPRWYVWEPGQGSLYDEIGSLVHKNEPQSREEVWWRPECFRQTVRIDVTVLNKKQIPATGSLVLQVVRVPEITC